MVMYKFTNKNKSMIYGYIRVSSDKQTVENQRFEIEKFCKVNNLHIDGWIEVNPCPGAQALPGCAGVLAC